MQHIVKRIKTVSKKYETKSGKKESISKRVDIGVTDLFDNGDTVAVLLKSDFDKLTTDSADAVSDLEKSIADKDATIDKFKKDIKVKTDKIAELSKEIKSLKTKIAELESDVSAKDETIGILTNDVAAKDEKLTNSGKTIDSLNDNVNELNATIGKLKPLLLSKNEIIADLEKQIAVYDAIDISDLKYKSSELDKSKNIIIKLQNEKLEYIQLVNYYKEKATSYKNQRWYIKAIGRDAAADISSPTLTLIDVSGNPVGKDDDTDETIDNPDNDSGKSTPHNKLNKV